MGHIIRAFIGKKDVAESIADDWNQKTIPLSQGFSLVFLTDALFDKITASYGQRSELDGSALEYLTTAVSNVLEKHSTHSSLAYIETEYFGGLGVQGGVLYENGQIVMPPASAEWDVINKVLEVLGVRCEDALDEFDSIGLGKYRHMRET